MKSLKTYQFTLALKNANENTSNLEDTLYEAGCDDALINFRNGAVYLDFDREAHSLEEAVVSAIKDVHSIRSFPVEVVSVAPENLVTESEIARRLGYTRQTVSLWIKGERRESFPHPIMRVAEKSPLWSWCEVVLWLYKNKIIENHEIVDHALFFANINAALEERDQTVRDIRHHLLKKISFQNEQRNYG